MRAKVGAFFYRFGTGESGADVFDRASTFLESLFREFKSADVAQNYIIVSHGLFMRLFLMRYFRWSVEYFQRVHNFTNATYVVLDFDRRTKKYVLSTPLKVDPLGSTAARPQPLDYASAGSPLPPVNVLQTLHEVECPVHEEAPKPCLQSLSQQENDRG